jgi:hypothetical protein
MPRRDEDDDGQGKRKKALSSSAMGGQVNLSMRGLAAWASALALFASTSFFSKSALAAAEADAAENRVRASSSRNQRGGIQAFPSRMVEWER